MRPNANLQKLDCYIHSQKHLVVIRRRIRNAANGSVIEGIYPLEFEMKIRNQMEKLCNHHNGLYQ